MQNGQTLASDRPVEIDGITASGKVMQIVIMLASGR
jgi:hypothetical protein